MPRTPGSRTKEAPVDPVAAAGAARDALIDRRAAGERIDPRELAAVDEQRRLAELEAEMEAEATVRKAEAERQAAFDSWEWNFSGPDLRATVSAILEAQDRAVEAMAELRRLTDAFTAEVSRLRRELVARAGFRTSNPPKSDPGWATLPAGIAVELPLDHMIVVDGVWWPHSPDLGDQLAAEAAALVLSPRIAKGLRDKVPSLGGHARSPSDWQRLIVESGAAGEPATDA